MRRVILIFVIGIVAACLVFFRDTGPREPHVIYVATPDDVVDKMLELAEIKPDDIVYDLGCGDGRIPIAASKKYGVKSWGFDNNPVRVRESLANVKKDNLEKLVTIKLQDILELDLKGADVIALYLFPELNARLIPQFEKLKPGARIVSHDFGIKGMRPNKTISVYCDGRDHLVHLWITPLQKEEKSE